MIQIIDITLHFGLLAMALWVCVRYQSMAQLEKTFSPNWFFITGTVFLALGIVLTRMFWTPWFVVPFFGIDSVGFHHDYIDTTYHWMLWSGRLAMVVGLFFHMKVRFEAISQ